MKFGLDLDHTVYGFPELFRELILALRARGHSFVCTSNHTKAQWEKRDKKRLRDLGIDPDWIDASRLPESTVTGPSLEARQSQKAPLADDLDYVFDNHADIINRHCKTPVLKLPQEKALDFKNP